jgi:hypothetical protein
VQAARRYSYSRRADYPTVIDTPPRRVSAQSARGLR